MGETNSMESPSSVGTKPQMAFPEVLTAVSNTHADCGVRVKVQLFCLSKCSVMVMRFCAYNPATMQHIPINKNNFLIVFVLE